MNEEELCFYHELFSLSKKSGPKRAYYREQQFVKDNMPALESAGNFIGFVFLQAACHGDFMMTLVLDCLLTLVTPAILRKAWLWMGILLKQLEFLSNFLAINSHQVFDLLHLPDPQKFIGNRKVQGRDREK